MIGLQGAVPSLLDSFFVIFYDVKFQKQALFRSGRKP